MRFVKAAALLMVALSGAMTAAPAFAHGDHVSLGLAIGWPGYGGPGYWGPGYWNGYWGPGWYYPPYYYPYYYPPVVPSSPPVYIERGDASERADSYWYYCPDSKTYYPYVKECASPWQRVPPRPPNS